MTENTDSGPDACGSVDSVSARKVKGRRFDSWSGHVPGLCGGYLVRVTLVFLALSPSLSLSLKINK